MDEIRRLIRTVPDFPEPGILFRDLTPVLEDANALATVIDRFAERYTGWGLTKICGIESRGFIFGAALAYRLGCGFSLVRKPGKLPRATRQVAYDLEYGKGVLHMHTDAMGPADRVVVIDDLIATGGTAGAAVQLAQEGGAQVLEVAVVIELAALGGRAQTRGVPVHALLTY